MCDVTVQVYSAEVCMYVEQPFSNGPLRKHRTKASQLSVLYYEWWCWNKFTIWRKAEQMRLYLLFIDFKFDFKVLLV